MKMHLHAKHMKKHEKGKPLNLLAVSKKVFDPARKRKSKSGSSSQENIYHSTNIFEKYFR